MDYYYEMYVCMYVRGWLVVIFMDVNFKYQKWTNGKPEGSSSNFRATREVAYVCIMCPAEPFILSLTLYRSTGSLSKGGVK